MPSTSTISVAEYKALIAAADKRKRGRRTRSTEEAIHRACIQWVALQSARHPLLRWLAHVPNGGKCPRSEAGKLRAMGVRPGLPDILLPRRSGLWTGLAVEIKSPSGRLSKSQQEWLAALAQDGWLTAVVRSVDEFQQVCSCFLNR